MKEFRLITKTQNPQFGEPIWADEYRNGAGTIDFYRDGGKVFSIMAGLVEQVVEVV